MARVFITGSSDGLGLLAGQILAEQGHTVVLHARNADRADAARRSLPACEAVVLGDVSSIANMQSLADQVNALGRFDAVIHNVGIGYGDGHRVETIDGLSKNFAINVVAPYLLSARIQRPDRLVYLSSGMHTGGDPSLDDLQWEQRPWNGMQAYTDTKLHDLMLAMALARLWPDVIVNAVCPGWVPTKMGGASAPDDLSMGAYTQTWLAASDDPDARLTGRYLHHQKPSEMHPAAKRSDLQDRLIDYLRDRTEVAL